MAVATGTEAEIWKALRLVIDPEIGLDIVTLGLVYGVEFAEGSARIIFTLTTPGCPMEAIITQGIRDAVAFVPAVTALDLSLVWDPSWHSGMIAGDAWTQ
jgi:metal-sulfur cluster biosynthetic enzyme